MMGFKIAHVQHHPHTFEAETQCFHSPHQRMQQEEHQEAVLRNFSALSMLMSTHRSPESGQPQDFSWNSCPTSRPLSSTPSLVSPSPFPCAAPAPGPAPLYQSISPRPADSKVCNLQSLESSGRCSSKAASSTSSADTLQSPRTPTRTFGNVAACPITYSSSPSPSSSQDTSPGMAGAIPCGTDMDTDAEAESTFSGVGKLRFSTRTLSQRRGLSSHFFGKSRSFTSLGDVASAQSIQDLAKPERPYPKRRRNSHSDRHHIDRLHSFEPSISKKECGRAAGGRILAAALAMAAGEAGGWGMATLQEA